MKRKVILDCDPGIDDSLAIMLALASPELDVRGITIVAGNAPLEMGYGNARKVLHFLDREDVPIYLGADRPLKRDYVSALDTHGADGLGESFLPDVPVTMPPEKSAVEFMREELHAGDCSIIALGPLTNLAELIRVDRDAFLAVDELVSMGGNFRSHGNCSPVAEYNYWEDPDSARIVFGTLENHNASCPRPNTVLRSMPASAQVPCGASDATGVSPDIERLPSTASGVTGVTADIPQHAASNPAVDIGRSGEKRPKLIRMVGLDVTRQIVLTPTLLEYIERLNPEVGAFVRKITKFYFDFHWAWEGIIGCVINDPLAVATFLDPAITSGFAAYTDIETGGISLGQSVVDVASFYQKPANAEIMTEVDVQKFWTLFVPRLVGKTAEECPLLEELI